MFVCFCLFITDNLSLVSPLLQELNFILFNKSNSFCRSNCISKLII